MARTRSPFTSPFRRRSRLGRRISGVVALAVCLLAVGGLYAAFVPQPHTATAQEGDAALVLRGQELFENHCITCHGVNLQGVEDRGPSLIGVGDAAVWFQVSTGRMPLARQEAQGRRKPPLPEFDRSTEQGMTNLDALGAYIQANGGGPTRPVETGEALRGHDPARGGELYRLNCASCHNSTGRGGALSSGKFAPILDPASELDIYTAMLTGPQNMPRFGDRQLTPEEKKDIISYVESVSGEVAQPGGYAAGRIGPTAEGLLVFLVGLSAAIAFALWLGARS